jgi:hypothetical protein
MCFDSSHLFACLNLDPNGKTNAVERPLLKPRYNPLLLFIPVPASAAAEPQFCTASASALHCTSPTTLLNSSSVLPIFTTEYLNILGSKPRVLLTACCVLALESKRTTK